MTGIRQVRLSEIVGKGYDCFWNDRSMYEQLKGGRSSKKSATMALRTIYRMMKYPDANMLVVRRVYGTLKDSCFAQLLWAIDRLDVTKYWKVNTNPLLLTYKPTGQQIIFRGLDDPLKITSIAVRRGYLCWVWIEEAYEITDPESFRKLELSIRGRIPPSTGLFKQFTFTFNPWRENWIKERFWDVPQDNVFL